MRGIAIFLGAIGGVLCVSALTLGLYAFGTDSWLMRGPLGLGAVLLVVWAVLDGRRVREWLTKRAGLYAGLTAGWTVVLVALLAAINVALVQRDITFDVSKDGVHSLSPQSAKILAGLTTDVRVRAFYEKNQPEHKKLAELMQRYQRLTDRVSFVVHSPSRDIAEVERYKVTAESARVIVETGVIGARDRREARFDFDLAALNHEEQLTNAIITATAKARPRLYFLTGHGEVVPSSKAETGYAQITESLSAEGYDVRPLHLVQQKAIPPDAAAVFIVAPRTAMLAPEMAALKAYMQRGGHLGVLLEPGSDGGLKPLLATYGIVLGDDVVLDLSDFGRMFGTGPDTAVAVDYDDHPVTRDFEGAASVFPRARSIRVGPSPTGGQAALSLVRTSDRAWGETDLLKPDFSPESEVAWSPGEVAGPVTVLAAATVPAPGAPAALGTPAAGSEARLLVAGDASFASNRFLTLSANRNLFLNMAGWLSGDASKVAIRPRTRGASRMVLSPAQREGLAFFVLYGLPVGVLALGLGLWLVRRQR